MAVLVADHSVAISCPEEPPGELACWLKDRLDKEGVAAVQRGFPEPATTFGDESGLASRIPAAGIRFSGSA